MRVGFATALALAGAGRLAAAADAKVTVVGWPGGPEETALRADTEIYNAKPEVTEANKASTLKNPSSVARPTSSRRRAKRE